jgi:hypothetical protein
MWWSLIVHRRGGPHALVSLIERWWLEKRLWGLWYVALALIVFFGSFFAHVVGSSCIWRIWAALSV